MTKLLIHSAAGPRIARAVLCAALIGGELLTSDAACAAGLRAGVAKVDITDREAGPVNDPLFVKALALQSDSTSMVIITIDAVAIGEIGRIGNDYLPRVRARLAKESKVPPTNVLINASHCHGIVRADIEGATVEAVKAALQQMAPVKIGSGVGHEDRIMENRRLKLKSGREADVRHAYALPPDDEVTEVGQVDPQIGILRIDRDDGRPLAVVYNFACHPIQGVPGGANTADLVGFASKAIEDSLGDGAMALFLQGCAGDINPAGYKEVDHPRSAEPLGNRLGLSTLKACSSIKCRDDDRLMVINETIELPRGDRSEQIIALETEQQRLLGSLKGTSLSLKTFLPLLVKYGVSGDFPSSYSHRYLHERMQGRDDLAKLDAENRRNIQDYVDNIHVMEELTRVQTNLALLRKHQASLIDSGKRTVSVELLAVRLGDMVLVTFPGELTVRIGLNVKQHSPHRRTLVAGYTNGYIYYAPTADQLRNVGGAQEDSDCILAPQWQERYESHVAEMLKKL